MRRILLVTALALAACGEKEITPEEQARIDEGKIAAVEAAQIIPPTPITPEKILYPDFENNNLFGAGCAFVPEGGGLGAIALTRAEVAFMKIDDEIRRFAADKGSSAAAVGTVSKYDARAYSMSLKIAEDTGRQSGTNTTDFDARLTVRNERDQIVFNSAGLAQCGL